jgi:hypothetical protein
MHRHRTDFVALFFGLAFLAAGAGFIAHQTTGHAFDVTWIAAVALVSIGCIFLGATLLRGPRSSRSLPSETLPPESAEPEAAMASATDAPSEDRE